MKLQELCELIVDCEHKTAPTQDTGYPSIRTPNIGCGYFLLDGVNRVSEETYRLWTRRAVPQPGDLIMAREAPVGNVAIIPPRLQPCLGQRTLLIRPDRSKVDPSFLNYFLNGPHVQGLIQAKTNGATVAHLNMEDVRTMELPDLPPLTTQRRTGEILSAYDDLIENNTRRIKILEEMAQIIYREWFVNFRFPGHEKVRMVESEMGRIPEGWTVSKIAEFGAVITGKTPSKEKPELYGSGMPFIKLPDMHGTLFILDTNEKLSLLGQQSQPMKTIRPNSLCVSCIGTAGIVTITTEPSQTNQQINSLIPSSPSDREFLYFRLVDLKETINQYGANGATMVNLNKTKFENLNLLKPDEALVQHFHEVVSPTFEQIKNLLRRNRILRRTRDLLLPKLISGEVSIEDVKTETLNQIS